MWNENTLYNSPSRISQIIFEKNPLESTSSKIARSSRCKFGGFLQHWVFYFFKFYFRIRDFQKLKWISSYWLFFKDYRNDWNICNECIIISYHYRSSLCPETPALVSSFIMSTNVLCHDGELYFNNTTLLTWWPAP